MKHNRSRIAATASPQISWPHAPLHRLADSGTYFLTVSTYLSQHHFRGPERLGVLHRGLLKVAADFRWQLEAWAVFSNHYHFVGHSPVAERGAASLPKMLGLLHEKTAKWLNRIDGAKGRNVWHNFRETRLTYEKSYLARLNYVHQNAVKHGLVPVANQYPWCSAAWFERTARPAQVKTVYGFKTDLLRVEDVDEVDPTGERASLFLDCAAHANLVVNAWVGGAFVYGVGNSPIYI